MSYPGRPPIVPGIPMPPSIGIPPYMSSIMPQVMTMPPLMPSTGSTISAPPVLRTYRESTRSSSSSSRYNYQQPPKRPAEGGPPITVFVGNIVEHAPDLMIRHILSACGQVISWKRIQGFGFCEFGSPESALRAVRLLHDMELGSKKLVVKVDAKTKVLLDDYKKDERKKQGKPELRLKEGEEIETEDYLNDSMKRVDLLCQDKVFGIVEDFEDDMNNALLEKTEEAKLKKEIQQNLPDKNKPSRNTEILDKLNQEHLENPLLKDTDIEDGKRDLITREIGKFREIMKKQEAEREEERARRELLEKERDKQRQERGERERSDRGDRGRSRSTLKSVSPSRSLTKSPTPSLKHRSKKRNRTRSRSRDRERERNDRNDRNDRVDRDRDKDRSKRDQDKEAAREREEEEEAKERRKLEKKAREKEAAYQERLRNWESRERRKAKEYEKERERERYKEEETAREAKKLKEFLEDYDDDRDDVKYYKGRELPRRLGDRDREKDMDNKDRQREKEEIEELKNRIMEEDHEDPTGTYEKLLREREEMYKPKILIDVNAEQMLRQKEKAREREERERQRLRELEKEREKEELRLLEEEKRMAERELAAHNRQQHHEADDDDDDGADDDRDGYSDRGGLTPGDGGISRDSLGAQPSPAPPSPQTEVVERRSPHGSGKKRKLDVKEVFNTDDDDSNLGSTRRRKLVPLDYGEEKEGKEREHKKSKKDKEKDKEKDDKKEDSSKSQEEKRKHIKSLIDKIPTDKSALFAFNIDWSAVDNQLMERRIRPWINKKIIEYIGEPEPTLVDFICSKVLAGSQPQGILDDVQMVLDEEAEVFVVKMWRLLIYEIEAKKLGLVK